MSPSPAVDALLVAAFGRRFEAVPLTGDGAALPCIARSKANHYVCGDIVRLQKPAHSGDEGVLLEAAPRRSLLWRSDAFRAKRIAANVSQVVIVTAAEPDFSAELVSRCLAAAQSENVKALIVLNKTDLTAKAARARARLADFVAAGYALLELCAHEDVSALRAQLAGEHSIFVGASGMGKSTLVNALLPGIQARTGEISSALNSGRHTTTFSRLYPLPDNAWLIDSPGLQAFGLAHLDEAALLQAFVEFRPYLGECRFRDCQHGEEPGCALQAAVQAGAISATRFAHFERIRAENHSSQKQARGW